MDTAKVANWVQIVGNLGIVAGLILVAVQINQASEQNRLQIYQDQAYRQVDGELALMGDTTIVAYSRAMTRPSELTEADIFQLWSYHSATIVPSFVTWTSHQAGRVSENDWNTHKAGVAFALDYPVGRVIWQQAKLQFPPEFGAEIDAELAARSRLHDGSLPALVGAIIRNARALPNVN